MNEACKSCQVIQKHELVLQAKIQSLSNEIPNQESLTTQLQEARSQMVILTTQNKNLQEQIQKHQTAIHQQAITIQSLEKSMQQISEENEMLLLTRGENASHEKMHKHTRTALPGEDLATEGAIMYPSTGIMNLIRENQKTQFTQKYVDPTGEVRLIPLVKLKINMYAAIRRHLSKRYRICQNYAQGCDAKKYWIAEPKCQQITRSMRAKCLSTLYNCCKYGILHWPDTDNEYNPEDTDEELL